MTRPNAVVLFGPPGAGKGTQASMLAQYPNVVHVSSGELSRSIDQDSELEARFKTEREELTRSNENGAVFSDALARDLLAHEIEHRGYGLETLLVLDGIPMTEGQVPLVDELVSVEAVIELYAADDVALIERMRERARKAGDAARPYDLDPERARERIDRYRSLTEPALDPYRIRGVRMFDIGALAGTPDQIHDAMLGTLATTRLAPWFGLERIEASAYSNYKSI